MHREVVSSIYRLGIAPEIELGPQQLSELLSHLVVKPGVQPSLEPLLGRRGLGAVELSGVGSLVIKSYMRGGLLRFFGSDLHLWLGKPRAQVEFEMLQEVLACGVGAPQPVAFVVQGQLFYRNWLVTRRIPEARNLVILLKENEELARLTTERCAAFLVRLIERGIYHVDMHPGNIVVDGEGNPYLLDFDKALKVNMRKSVLRDKYLCRWRRAVLKHDLPDTLAEVMSSVLLANFKEKLA